MLPRDPGPRKLLGRLPACLVSLPSLTSGSFWSLDTHEGSCPASQEYSSSPLALTSRFSSDASLVLPLSGLEVAVTVWCRCCRRTTSAPPSMGAGLSPSCKSSCFVCRKRYAKRSLQLFCMHRLGPPGRFLTLRRRFKYKRPEKKKNCGFCVIQIKCSALLGKGVSLLSFANHIFMVFTGWWKLN